MSIPSNAVQVDWVKVSVNRLRLEAYAASPASRAKEALKVLTEVELTSSGKEVTQKEAQLREVRAAQERLQRVVSDIAQQTDVSETTKEGEAVEGQKTFRSFEGKA